MHACSVRVIGIDYREVELGEEGHHQGAWDQATWDQWRQGSHLSCGSELGRVLSGGRARADKRWRRTSLWGHPAVMFGIHRPKLGFHVCTSIHREKWRRMCRWGGGLKFGWQRDEGGSGWWTDLSTKIVEEHEWLSECLCGRGRVRKEGDKQHKQEHESWEDPPRKNEWWWEKVGGLLLLGVRVGVTHKLGSGPKGELELLLVVSTFQVFR